MASSVFYNRDLLTGCILKHLSLFDIFSLFLTSKQIKATYVRMHPLGNDESATLHLFYKRMHDALTLFYSNNEAATRLIHLVKNGSLYLTGGFLLALINADDITQCEDVDFAFILSKDDTSRVVTFNYGNAVNRQACFFFNYAFQQGTQNMMVTNDLSSLCFYQSCIACREFETTNKKFIQFICLDLNLQRDTKELLLASYCRDFDLKFCANYFSNNKLICFFSKHVREKSVIVGPDDVERGNNVLLERSQDILPWLQRFEQRITKYKRRGYHCSISGGFKIGSVWFAYWQNKLF